MGLWFQAQIYFKNKAAYLLAFNCFIEFLIVIALGYVSVQRGYNEITITEIYRWFAISLGFLAQIYFAMKAIKKGNIVQLKAFLLLSIITTGFICIRFASIWANLTEKEAKSVEWILITLTIVIIINQIFFFLSYSIAKDRFIDRMMEEIPAIEEDINNYEIWSELKAMLIINFLYQVLVIMGFVAFYDYPQSKEYGHFWWYIIDGAVLVVFALFTRVGYVATKSKEKVELISIFLIVSIVLQIYELARLFMLYQFVPTDEIDKDFKLSILISQSIVGFGSLLIQFYTYYLGYRFKNMGYDAHRRLGVVGRSIEESQSLAASRKLMA